MAENTGYDLGEKDCALIIKESGEIVVIIPKSDEPGEVVSDPEMMITVAAILLANDQDEFIQDTRDALVTYIMDHFAGLVDDGDV